jgi:hypothetical protein
MFIRQYRNTSNICFFKELLVMCKVKYETNKGIKTLRKRRKAIYNFGLVVVFIHLNVSNKPKNVCVLIRHVNRTRNEMSLLVPLDPFRLNISNPIMIQLKAK